MNKFALLSLLAGVLGGCAAAGSGPSGPSGQPTQAAPAGLASLAGSAWLASSLATAAALPGGQPIVPQLKFVSLTQVAGNGGCNAFGGQAVVAGESLRLGPLASTRKMCQGPAMDAETAFFKAVERARQGRLVQGQLALLDEAGVEVLRLQRAE